MKLPVRLRLGMRPNRLRGIAALAVTAGVASFVVLNGDAGFPAGKVNLRAGTAWLASAQIGQVTLVDGASAQVAATVPVAAAASPLRVEQQGSSAYVLNQANGTLVRVDGATQRVSHRVTPFQATGDDLTIMATADSLYTLDSSSGMLAPANLETLTPQGNPQKLAAGRAPASPVVDGHGRLWAIEQETGELVWLSNGQRQTRAAAAAPGSPRLTITQDRPALVDPARGTAEQLNPETGAVSLTVRPDIKADDVIAVSGSTNQSRLLLAVSTRGAFIACAFETGTCSAPVEIGTPQSDFGVPIEVDNYAVVPDYATGQAAVIDLTTARVIAQRQLFDRPVRFELVTRDGIVFFNDPASNRAGVLDLTGNIRLVTKYDQPNRDDGSATSTGSPNPTPQPPAGSGDNPGQTGGGPGPVQPGPGIPKQPLPQAPPTSSGPKPAPAPAMSIVVKPSSRGYVGQQFELSLVSRSPATVTQTRWQFGDGGEVTGGTTVRHSWDRAGSFRVRAAATLANGDKPPVAEVTVIVDVPGAPPRIERVNIQRPTPVVSEQVHFSADILGTAPSKWLWTISDPRQPNGKVTATTPEFDYTFSTAGSYTIDLAVSAADGASTRTSRRLTVALGNVKAWGYNIEGQVSPLPPAAGSGVVAVSCGYFHSLALKADGSVIGWGWNTVDQVTIPASAKSGVVAVSASSYHNLALKADGSVIGWGHDGDFRLTTIPPEASAGVVGISTGETHNLVVKADGTVIGWGDNRYFQATVPPEARTGAIAVSGGWGHSLVLKSDGSVVGWGFDLDGAATIPPEAKSGVIAIAAGYLHSMVLKSDGSVIAWGANDHGEINVPPQAKSGVVAIAAGHQHSYALKADGTVIAWGRNTWGEVTVPPQAAKATSVCGGLGHTLVV